MGTLAAKMSKTGKIGSVNGLEVCRTSSPRSAPTASAPRA